MRVRQDVTQLDVAKAVGVSGAAVSDWEADKKVPREDALMRLAKFLRVTPQFLRYGVLEPAAGVPMHAEFKTFTAEEIAEAVAKSTPEAMAEVKRIFEEAERAAARARGDDRPRRRSNGR